MAIAHVDRTRDARTAGSPSAVPRPVVVDTTELRWFASGRLPTDVRSWFTGPASDTHVEERTDRYRLDRRDDLGVKLRFGSLAEVKVRRTVGTRMALSDTLAGRPERWRKWTPADDLVDGRSPDRWVDVRKHVIRRRFLATGEETALVPGAPAPTIAACDVEIVALTVGQVDAWSWAMAAYGPEATVRATMAAAWVVIGDEAPAAVLAVGDRSLGYPAWLRSTV